LALEAGAASRITSNLLRAVLPTAIPGSWSGQAGLFIVRQAGQYLRQDLARLRITPIHCEDISSLSAQAVEALMALDRICDPTAAFALRLPPPFIVPLFPSPTVKPFTLTPSLWRRRRSGADLDRKSRRRLHLHLGIGWLNPHGASKEKRPGYTKGGPHNGSFRLLLPTLETMDWFFLFQSLCAFLA